MCCCSCQQWANSNIHQQMTEKTENFMEKSGGVQADA
jgi:hypothetical protein